MKARNESCRESEPQFNGNEVVPDTFRRLALENAEQIGAALVQKAGEGNYNAAHLLLEMGGVVSRRNVKADVELENPEPRMFLLDLVDKMLLAGKPGEHQVATDMKTQADRHRRIG